MDDMNRQVKSSSPRSQSKAEKRLKRKTWNAKALSEVQK